MYRQIADWLRREIRDDGLVPGDKVPSEPELADRLNVARATVAKAFDVLVSEGLIARHQGRGSFVSQQPLARKLPELTGFTEHVRSLGHRSGQRLVSYLEQDPPYADDTLLAPFDDERLAVVTRVRLIDDEPAGLHRTAVPLALAQRIGFVVEELRAGEVSLYACFEDHGVMLDSAEEHLRAVNADDETADLLGLENRAALMHVRRLTRDHQGRLVEAVDAFYIGHLYDYVIELTRPSAMGEREHDGGTTVPSAGTGSGPRLVRSGLRR